MIHLLALLSQSDVNIPKSSLDSRTTIPLALNIVFGIAGAIALLMIVIGGLKYVLSHGDTNAVKSAKETIIYAVVGLVVTIAAYGIVGLAVKSL